MDQLTFCFCPSLAFIIPFALPKFEPKVECVFSCGNPLFGRPIAVKGWEGLSLCFMAKMPCSVRPLRRKGPTPEDPPLCPPSALSHELLAPQRGSRGGWAHSIRHSPCQNKWPHQQKTDEWAKMGCGGWRGGERAEQKVQTPLALGVAFLD